MYTWCNSMQEWRIKNRVDAALETSVPRFFDIKDAYVHSIIGRTRDGIPVLVEGMGNFRNAMARLRPAGITPEELIHQFVFVMEWITRKVEPSPYPNGKFIRIYDFKGFHMSDIADKEALDIGKKMMEILETYYPERMARAYIVNVPSFFSMVWTMVKPMLDPRTSQKIVLISAKKAILNTLREIMDDDVIPVEYGGKNLSDGWYSSAEEKALTLYVSKLNATRSVTQSASSSSNTAAAAAAAR